MKKYVIFFIVLSLFSISFAQPFWTEDFGTGCTQGTLADGLATTNGLWTVTHLSSSQSHSNLWFVSATEAGMGAGNCGNGCLDVPTLLNRTLHVGNAAVSLLSLPADNGASYNTGGTCSPPFNICVATDSRIESPIIDCSGKTNITLSFVYIENGESATDNATLWFFDGASWILLDELAKTTIGCPSGQGLWTAFSILLPSEADNNSNIKIGFRWQNNDDATGNDPSFAVDDISLSVSEPVGLAENKNFQVSIFPNPTNEQFTVSFIALKKGNYSMEIFNPLGQVLLTRTIENFSGKMEQTFYADEFDNGLFFIGINTPDEKILKKIIIE